MLLLIEPVWNRNLALRCRYCQVNSTFNRTSMESKPFRVVYGGLVEFTFNRTSMESKLKTGDRLMRFSTYSFNRTSMESKLYLDFNYAVTRFTFNRTSMESKHKYFKDAEIAEPIF